MKKSEWSDNELEELLRQMPKVRDHRDPHDIYQNIFLKKRKTKSWLLPGMAAAAAFLLFIILVPKLMGGTNFSYDRAQEEKSSITNKKMELSDRESTIALKKDESSAKEQAYSETEQSDLIKSESMKTAIYEDELGNGTVFTYWIPDPQAQILIPISTIVNDTQEQSWLSLYTKTMANLKEEEWGLSNFYPLNATMELDKSNSSVLVNVPANHQYGQGSANETIFMNVLKKDISSNSNLKKIKFSTNGEPGIQFGNFGRIEEVDVTPEKKHAILFYYTFGSDIPFLTPSVDTYGDVNTAFEAMKKDQPLQGLKSSLIPFQPITDISVIDKTLFLSFKGISDLKDDQRTLSSFEALLLTAKEFGLEKVVVKDSAVPFIGPFDLSKENKVPVAPNLRKIQ
ncbi:negative regulator of sigma-X activity [Neobacillus drentensis]|uniref:negative regulator of sigma-X activity n=1 Tax=Neobacillus drentensis TaxID=220684 RepID=UPI002FFE97BC